MVACESDISGATAPNRDASRALGFTWMRPAGRGRKRNRSNTGLRPPEIWEVDMPATGHYETCCATVERVERGAAYVAIAQKPMAEACRKCGACGGTAAQRKPVRLRVSVDRTDYEPGQQVHLHRYVLNPALSAALVFGPPLSGALAGIVGASQLPAAGGPDSPASFFGGLIGAAAGTLVGLVAERYFVRTRPPTIVHP